MSSSEPRDDRPRYRLIVEAPEPGMGVLVIDAEGNIVERCADDQTRLEVELPRGLYTVRSNRCGAFAETVVRLDSPQTVKAAIPAVFSAATVPGAESTHEYYTYPAWEISQRPTAPEQGWNGAIDAGLLLFARAPNRDAHAGERQFASLSLRALDGRALSTFDSDIEHDATTGWSAYSARLSHGLLILEDRGERPRQVPMPLIRGWQTQCFVMHHGRLLWEDMRLTMVAESQLSSRQHRSPYDHNAGDVRTAVNMDIGLLALQNDAPSVAPQLIETFLNSKHHNPILGLLGAYLLLLHHRREQERKNPEFKPDSALIRTVLNNLHQLIPMSADVAALRLLAKDWVEPPKLEPIDRVPLFRCGAEALLRAAASDPELLPEGSLLDAVSDNLYGDTVWTTWKPIALPIGARIASFSSPRAIESTTEVAIEVEGWEEAADKDETGSWEGSADEDKDEVETTMTAEVMASEPSWVELAVVDAIATAERSNKSLTADDLVRSIGVSPHSVRTAMDALTARAAARKLPIQAEKSALRMLSGEVARTLARKLGARSDDNLWSRVLIGTSDAAQTAKPSMQQVYAGLKKTLSEFADANTGKVSADTILANILKSDDIRSKRLIRQRLLHAFRDIDLKLSVDDLDQADTVRDLAKLIRKRGSD